MNTLPLKSTTDKLMKMMSSGASRSEVSEFISDLYGLGYEHGLQQGRNNPTPAEEAEPNG